VGTLILALVRYEAAAALGLLLLGIVRIEPAPVDAVFAVIIAIGIVTGRINLRSAPLWMLALLGAFVALNLLACIEAEEIGEAAFFLSITVYCLLLGVWTSSFVRSPDRARTVLVCYLAVSVVSALVSTLALYVTFPASELFTAFEVTRARGLFKDPNVYGPFLVVAAILLLVEILEPRLLKVRTLFKLLMLGILCVGVFTAYSRAAWLNIGVAVAVLLAVLPFRRGGVQRAVGLMIAVVIGLAAVVTVVALTGSGDFVEERARYQTYDNDRFGGQELGLQLARRHPIGIGPGQYEVVLPIAAHSTYIRTLTEQGVLGFVLWVAIALGTLLLALRNVIEGRSTFGLPAIALLAAWCGILANSLFVDTLHWRHLWIVAGLIWAASYARPQASSNAGERVPT
jgi:O-antigen ligase